MLPVLGSKVKSLALPTVASCPLCKSSRQLHVYQDLALGGEWAHCRDCSFSGDMISLAAAVWKLGIPQTLRRLARDVDEISSAVAAQKAISDYQECHVKPRKRLREFWETCQKTHIQGETSDLRMLQRHFGCYQPGDDWAERAGQFIGSAPKAKADKCFNPRRVKTFGETSQGGYSSCIFRGGGWNHVISVPFYDLPGRICGCLFIGRDAAPHKDYVFKGTLDEVHESGLAMLDALLLPPHRRLGKTGFVFTDVALAMRFHIRHMNDTRLPLPLAATWQDNEYSTSRVWDWFSHTDLVFWGTDLVESIHQAQMANGAVSMLEVSETEQNNHNLDHYTPAEWLERMKTAAVPWRSALRTYLGMLNDDAIEGTLLSLGMQGRQLTEFIQGCDPELRERLAYVEQHRTYAAKVRFEKHWVFEKADGWYLEKGQDRISNAVVRIEQVLTTLDHRSYYRGIIKFHGESYPFTEKAATLDKGMLAWAQAYIRDVVQAGVPEFYPSWNKKSVQLALAFHTPDYAQGVESIGWDGKNRQFNFPTFSICRNGDVTTDFSCLFDHDRVPAKEVPQPGNFPRKHIETLSDTNDEIRIFWATAASIASNILAPAVNRNQVPLLLDGEGAWGVGVSAAARMGCCTVPAQSRNDVTQTLATAKGQHSWPFITLASGGLRPGTWLDSDVAQFGIYCLPHATNRVLAIRGRAHMISCDRKLGSMQLAHHAAPYVLANYIQDAYRRNLWITDEHDALVLNVLDDMTDWFNRCGGNREAVEAARTVLHTPGPESACKHFLDLVFRLYEDGALTFARSTYDDSKQLRSGIVQVEGDKHLIWVSQDRFSDAVKLAGTLPPDLLLITKALEAEGVLLSEPDYRDEQGWLIPDEWWNSQLENWRTE